MSLKFYRATPPDNCWRQMLLPDLAGLLTERRKGYSQVD